MKRILFALLTLLPLAVWADCQCDADADGVIDMFDNCYVVANPDQRDTDNDAFGNMCDGDFDNDGFVSTPDAVVFRSAMFTHVGQPDYNEDADFDGDGVVSTPDLVIFREMMFQPVGPAGYAVGSCN